MKRNPSPTDLAERTPRRRDTVLFVDDEVAILDGLTTALRKEPYEVVTANSAAKGFQILASRPVDVVVSDERMPALSGSEFLSRVRLEYPETVRIILTGQASLTAAIRAINQGEIFRFLTKPCSPAELAQTIQQALLLRALSKESARLLKATREQRATIQELERQHPGISRINRTQDGCIVLDNTNESVEELVAAIRAEIDLD